MLGSCPSDIKLRYHAGLHRPLKSVDWALVVLVVRATESLSTEVGTGVLWVLTGPTRVMPASRQDDGNIRAPALACVVCVAVQVVAVARARSWSFYCQLDTSARTSEKKVRQ